MRYTKYNIVHRSKNFILDIIPKHYKNYDPKCHFIYSRYSPYHKSISKVNNYTYHTITLKSHPKDLRIIQLIHLI